MNTSSPALIPGRIASRIRSLRLRSLQLRALRVRSLQLRALRAASRLHGPDHRAAAFVALVSALLVILALAETLTARQALIEETSARVQTRAIDATRLVEDRLALADAALSGLIAERGEETPAENLTAEERVRLQALMQDLVARGRVLRDVALHDAAGTLLLASRPAIAETLTMAGADGFQHLRDSPSLAAHIGTPVRDPGEGDTVVTLSRRITTRTGRFAGVAVAHLPLRALLPAPGRGPEPGLRLVLARQDGMAIGETAPRSDDADPFSFTTHPRRFPIQVTAAITRADALAPWRATAWRIAGLTLVLVAGLGAIGRALTRDLRRRRLATDALRDSEARYRQIADTVTDVILLNDHHLRRIFVSPSCEAMLGYTPEEMLHGQAGGFVADEHRAEVVAALQAMVDGQPARNLQFKAIRRDGTEIWVEARHSLLHDPESGLPHQYVTVMRDVTAHKQIEQRLEHAREQAELASRAKSMFLANMSHEIRTPMNGVIGMTGLLLATPLAEDQRRYASAVQHSADALMRIIDDILDISKLEAGKIELEDQPFPVDDLLDDVVELLSPRAHERRIEIVASTHSVARLHLRGDAMRLRQVVLNLASNAVKFTERGFVALEASATPATDGWLTLRVVVQDTGIGIDPEAVKRLFTKFQQADGSVARRFGGTGLGLAISRQLIELMGGRIGVDSEPGWGSRFWFEVRLQVADKMPAPKPDIARLAGLRALCVDDLPINRTIIERQLIAAGMKVDLAVDGPSALRLLGNASALGTPYDVLVVDHAMPGTNGLAVAKAAREMPRPCARLVVLLSSLGLRETDPTHDSVRFDASLTKPVRHRDLLNCLSSLVVGLDTQPNPPHLLPAPTEPTAPAPVRVPERAFVAVPPPSPQSAPATGRRILVAEDNPINRMLVEALLQQAGYRLDFAEDGAQAIAAAAANRYDLILMDIQMPNVDGIEATRAIRALDDAHAKVPIVALTANAMAGDRDIYLAASMNDYLSKPLNPPALLAMVARWAGETPSAPLDRGILEARLLDETALETLSNRLSPTALRRMVVSNLKAVERHEAEMRDLLTRGDLGELARRAQDVRRNASSIGALRLQQLAEAVGAACQVGDSGRAQALLRDITGTRDDTLSGWEDHLHIPTPAETQTA